MMLFIIYCIPKGSLHQIWGQFLIYFSAMSIQIDEIIRTDRRSIAILIDPRGRLVVRSPLKVPLNLINAFVASKQAWIEQKLAEAREREPRQAIEFKDGENFLLLGEKRTLRLISQSKKPLTLVNQEFILHKEHRTDATMLFEKMYKKVAKQYLSERLDTLSTKYGYKFTRMRITSARTRWGSCSSTGTISFTWRLIMAPVEVIDYVVIHELVHIGIKDHSKRFWGKVESLMPEYKKHKNWLKVHGGKLSLGGAQ